MKKRNISCGWHMPPRYVTYAMRRTRFYEITTFFFATKILHLTDSDSAIHRHGISSENPFISVNEIALILRKGRPLKLAVILETADYGLCIVAKSQMIIRLRVVLVVLI